MSGFWIPHSAPLKDLVFLRGTLFIISDMIICFYEHKYFELAKVELKPLNNPSPIFDV